MGRIVGFIGVRTSVGSTTLCFEMAQNLSMKNLRVCVIDFYFSMNDISQKFNKENKFDLKDFLIGKVGADGIVEQERDNLYFIRTNAARFDYCRYKDDIKKLITMLAYKFDYILIDVNSFDSKNLLFAVQCLTEAYIIFDNEPNSIRLIARMVKMLKQNSNIENIKYVFNKSKIIGQINKRYLSRLEIEELLSEDVIFEIPKFLNHNFLNNNKTIKQKNRIMNNFCNSFITNKVLHFNYSKKYKGFLGKIKRKLLEKYE